MTLKFLVFSFDDSNLNSKQIQAKTKAEAIEKSGFSSAIAIASEVSAEICPKVGDGPHQAAF